MKNILVPIGHRKSGLNALRYAIDFAKTFDSRIYLVHVYSSTKISGAFVNFDQILLEESNRILEDYMSQLEKNDVEIFTSSVRGHDVLESLKQIIKNNEIDLIISSAKNDDSDQAYFIGKITGGLIKDTTTPVLIIPKKYAFKPIRKILMTVKSGTIKSVTTLDPLQVIQKKYNSTINLLQVKTPKFKSEDVELNDTLKGMIAKQISTRNATVYHGVLEFLHEENPDMLCVIRRKRGFFAKLWENDRIKKVDFESIIPLLVLKGLS